MSEDETEIGCKELDGLHRSLTAPEHTLGGIYTTSQSNVGTHGDSASVGSVDAPHAGAKGRGGWKGNNNPTKIIHRSVARINSRAHFHYRERGKLAASVELPQPWFAVFLDFAGAFTLLVELLSVPEAVFAMCGSISSVLLYHHFAPQTSANLTWVAVTIMLVFPITNSISNAFKRREGAIFCLNEFRALLSNIYSAHTCWDWPGPTGWHGRGEDGISKDEGGTGVKGKGLLPLDHEHGEQVQLLMHAIVDSVQELLLVPRRGRMRHIHTPCGRSEMKQVVEAECKGRQEVIRLIGRLHRATESLKAAGMPANEASRINAYVCRLTTNFERLWSYKTYRTSVALRGMAHITTQLMPAFYGPYYLHISRGEGDESNLVFACCFACLNSLLLVGLQSLERLLENPFRDGATDNIRVKEEMRLCRETLSILQNDTHDEWYQGLEQYVLPPKKESTQDCHDSYPA